MKYLKIITVLAISLLVSGCYQNDNTHILKSEIKTKTICMGGWLRVISLTNSGTKYGYGLAVDHYNNKGEKVKCD